VSAKKGPYIEFIDTTPAKRATGVWHVKAIGDGTFLGCVKWFGRWRRYAFFPAVTTVFEDECMDYISGFIKARMAERREARRVANEG
jgi:hypothetical protein